MPIELIWYLLYLLILLKIFLYWTIKSWFFVKRIFIKLADWQMILDWVPDCHHSVGHISQFESLKYRASLPAAFLFQIGPVVAYRTSLAPYFDITTFLQNLEKWKTSFQIEICALFLHLKKVAKRKMQKVFFARFKLARCKSCKKMKNEKCKIIFLQISRIWLKNKIVANCILRCWKIRFD